MNGLTIGRLAKRFYDRQCLIEPPPRTESNYRIYPQEEVARLRFIKKAKSLGFTLNEIKELMFVRHDPHATKADIKDRTLAKIKDIEGKIADLTRIKAALEHLASSCDGHGSLDECPILEALDSDNNELCKH